MKVKKAVLFITILLAQISSSLAFANSVEITRNATCGGGIDGSGNDYLKICAKNRAAYLVELACQQARGTLGSVESGNPWFPCKSVGDMTQVCEGNASGECYLP